MLEWIPIIGSPQWLRYEFNAEEVLQYRLFIKHCEKRGIVCHKCWWGSAMSKDFSRVKCWGDFKPRPIPCGQCSRFILDDRLQRCLENPQSANRTLDKEPAITSVGADCATRMQD